MAVFVDSGILLRALHRGDPNYPDVRNTFRSLLTKRETIFAGLQQLAEFWNVSTRPASARGGFDLSTEEASRRLNRIERAVTILTETPITPEIWKRLVRDYRVRGVQVHDARTVALMLTHSVSDLITLNKSDFVRYESAGINPITPGKFAS